MAGLCVEGLGVVCVLEFVDAGVEVAGVNAQRNPQPEVAGVELPAELPNTGGGRGGPAGILLLVGGVLSAFGFAACRIATATPWVFSSFRMPRRAPGKRVTGCGRRSPPVPTPCGGSESCCPSTRSRR